MASIISLPDWLLCRLCVQNMSPLTRIKGHHVRRKKPATNTGYDVREVRRFSKGDSRSQWHPSFFFTPTTLTLRMCLLQVKSLQLRLWISQQSSPLRVSTFIVRYHQLPYSILNPTRHIMSSHSSASMHISSLYWIRTFTSLYEIILYSFKLSTYPSPLRKTILVYPLHKTLSGNPNNLHST